ncbi:MAG: hypothetical protein WCD20_03295 [Rhodomicrobium sp.]
MFIELHLKSDKTPVIVGLHHIVKITAAGAEGGTVVELAGGGTMHVTEAYADIRRSLEPR